MVDYTIVNDSPVGFIQTIFKRSTRAGTEWHSILTKEQEEDLEIVQKSALKIIKGTKYESYERACESLNLEDLITRRTRLCL